MDDSGTVTFRNMDEADDEVASVVSDRSDESEQQVEENVTLKHMLQAIQRLENRVVGFEDKLTGLQEKIDLTSNQNQNHQIAGHGDVNENAPEIETNRASSNLRRGHNSGSPHSRQIANEPFRRSGDKVRMKPHSFNGTEDLEEYLTQFQVIAEINDWNYVSKSLYLASSLTGGARALLNELDERERRDYSTLVDALQNRYGSYHRAEVFRSQLQGRMKQKDESLTELAQSVRKMTRKAYPNANSEVSDVIALDHFIDAIPDTDIRLRLREISPRSITEAETIAVRLEAHRVADRQRTKQVRVVENEKAGVTLQGLEKSVSDLVKEVKEMKKSNQKHSYHSNDRNQNTYQNRGGNYGQNQNSYSQQRQNGQRRDGNYSNNTQRWNGQSRGDNPQRGDNFQGNWKQSSLGASARPQSNGPYSTR